MRFGRTHWVGPAVVVAALLGAGPAAAERHPPADAATGMLACATSMAGTAALTSIGILGSEPPPAAGARRPGIGMSHVLLWGSGLIALGALGAARLVGPCGSRRREQGRV